MNDLEPKKKMESTDKLRNMGVGECNDCPIDKLTDFCIGCDDLLEWLRGDAE